MHAIEITATLATRLLDAIVLPPHATAADDAARAITPREARAHVLVLDAPLHALPRLRRELTVRGFHVTTVATSEEVLRAVAADDVSAFLANVDAPEIAQTGLLSRLRTYAPSVTRIALTAERDFAKVSRGAASVHADAMLPLDMSGDEVAAVLTDILARGRSIDENVSPDDARRTARGLVRALALRNYESEAHCQRVSRWAKHLARVLGLSPGRVLDVELGAYLHDIGQIGVRDAVLLKPSNLTEEEWRELRKHPDLGAELLMEFPVLRRAIPIVQCHHERRDGGGYPRGLRGNAIPLDARIFQVVDAYDALIAERPYRVGRSDAEARSEITEHSGTQFDPEVVEAFMGITALELQSIARADTA